MHLADIPRCLRTLQACFPPLGDAQVLDLDAQDHELTLTLRAQGWGTSKALEPMRRVHGPALPLPDTVDAMMMLARWLTRCPEAGSAYTHLLGHRLAHAD